MKLRTYLLLAACLLCLAAIVLTLALVGTPEVTGWAATAARAALGSSAVGLMLAGAAVLFLGSLAVRAWAIARGTVDTHDDTAREGTGSRGPLPDTFRAPCGEVARLPERVCEKCGRRVVQDPCGRPWCRGHVTTGFHLSCGHGFACHEPDPWTLAHPKPTDSGRPAA